MALYSNIARRKENIKKRKNALPLLILTTICWSTLSFLIFFIDPDIFLAVPLFFILTFLTLFFTFSIIFLHQRRAFLAAAGILIFLGLRYLGIGNLLNGLLLVGLLIAFELWFAYT